MKHPAQVVLLAQAALTMSLGSIAYFVFGLVPALSAVVGGSVAIIPQGLFGFWVFRKRGALNARVIARNFFVGEALKLSITAVVFTLVWTNVDRLEASAVLTGFVITVLVGQLSLPLLLSGARTH
jgi:ATP synthase protein I